MTNVISKEQRSAIYKMQAVLTAQIAGKNPFFNLANYIKWGLVELKDGEIVVTQKGKDLLSVTI